MSKNRRRRGSGAQRAQQTSITEHAPRPDRERGRLLTIAEVQERCGVKERTVRTWVFERRLPYVKLGRYVRIAERDLEAFIRAGRVEADE